jgi:hypothetical protein
MSGAKVILSVGICLGVAAGMVSACSSSSGSPGPSMDGSLGPDVRAADSSPEAGGSCNPFAIELCPQGQTCCSTGLRGTCTEVGACSAPFRVSCVNAASCGTGVCCGSVQLAGFDASALGDASFDAAPMFDASGFSLSLECAPSCAFPAFQACMTSQDCRSDYVCGGGPGNGPRGGDPSLGLILACVPADAGFGPPEAGPEPMDGGPAEASPPGPDAADGG